MDDRELLARLLWGENRNLGRAEAKAIGATVLNRTKLRGFPDTPAEVMTQPRQYYPLNPGDPNYEKSMGLSPDGFGPHSPDWKKYMEYAGDVMLGGSEGLPYTHYFTGERPAWSYSLPLERIGSHWFGTEQRRPKTAEMQLAALTSR